MRFHRDVDRPLKQHHLFFGLVRTELVEDPSQCRIISLATLTDILPVDVLHKDGQERAKIRLGRDPVRQGRVMYGVLPALKKRGEDIGKPIRPNRRLESELGHGTFGTESSAVPHFATRVAGRNHENLTDRGTIDLDATRRED